MPRQESILIHAMIVDMQKKNNNPKELLEKIEEEKSLIYSLVHMKAAIVYLLNEEVKKKDGQSNRPEKSRIKQRKL